MKGEVLCNDIHSKLNATVVAEVVFPETEGEVVAAIRRAELEDRAVSICGGRHAMGGQQFGEGTMLLDLTGLDFVGEVDREAGTVEVGAGVKWPALIAALHAQQEGEEVVWTIRQKQTGADNLTLGGALAANIHGRGLFMKPMIGDVESFRVAGADGVVRRCSREENADWFGLVIGGYGCFGVVTSVVVRLAPRTKLRRMVEVTTLDLLPAAIRGRMADGCVYGDFQFSIDECSEDFLWKGVLSTYRPVEGGVEIPEGQDSLGVERWKKLVEMAHVDRGNIFKVYSDFYLSTDGNLYGSDTHQLSVYVDDYHAKLDEVCGSLGSEMITELYVPHEGLIAFMRAAAVLLKERGIPVIYGTMRLIREDDESFLAWARGDMACVIFNLHVEHDEGGIAEAKEAFRGLIDLAISRGGSYFLTYHRWATKEQVEAAYPRFREFLGQKNRWDPDGRFQSEWWRYYRGMFGE